MGEKKALPGIDCWNWSGGYHHVSRGASEGFCIYNDIGIAIKTLRKESLLSEEDKILIIDIDAHHGNGNANTFMDDSSITLFDIYNDNIYPNDEFTKRRVNINVPLNTGTPASVYINSLENALNQISESYTLAFVVAGTDVLVEDPLGGMMLSVEDCANRDLSVAKKLKELSIPFVFTVGGGYSEHSASAMYSGIRCLSTIC